MPVPLQPSANPYSSPSQHGTIDRGAKSRQLPTFPRVVFLLDFFLCMIRGALVIMGVVSYLAIRQQEPDASLLVSFQMELLAGVAIVLTGIPANAAMLSRCAWGALLAWLCATATLASFAIGLWQIWLTVGMRAE